MFTLQAGYQVRDYAEWKRMFDRDPAGRAASGARSFRVFRDADDGNYVVVHLDFDTRDAANAFLERLRSQVWNDPDVMEPLLLGTPTARILEQVAGEVLATG
ncbi:putative quinol monooxygenase [Arthrobacter sp. GCM10027362]|uniref:putative quinol monooxygenase n=1 Tax=Arthrobacter sp. GCM10027362 TaxID=3273379 RepID=UPI003625C582